jgi:ubiquinone/menaquinone biosynthesis C-methylase UbiE
MPLDHFALIAGLYDRTAKYSPPAQLLDMLALPPEGRLLNAGGGTGRIAEVLRAGVRETVVMDSSRGMLHYAVKKNLATVCAVAEQLPLASFSFDRIIMVDALHHVFDQRQTIKELWRVLAPGGRIIIVEPDIHKFTVKLIAVGEKLLFMRSHFLSSERIASILGHLSTNVRIISNESSVWVSVERVREM